MLLDDAAGTDNAPHLMATAPRPCVRVSPATAQARGLAPEALVEVQGPRGGVVLPLEVVPGMCDDVVWVPQNSGASVTGALGAVAGDRVRLVGGAA